MRVVKVSATLWRWRRTRRSLRPSFAPCGIPCLYQSLLFTSKTLILRSLPRSSYDARGTVNKSVSSLGTPLFIFFSSLSLLMLMYPLIFLFPEFHKRARSVFSVRASLEAFQGNSNCHRMLLRLLISKQLSLRSSFAPCGIPCLYQSLLFTSKTLILRILPRSSYDARRTVSKSVFSLGTPLFIFFSSLSLLMLMYPLIFLFPEFHRRARSVFSVRASLEAFQGNSNCHRMLLRLPISKRLQLHHPLVACRSLIGGCYRTKTHGRHEGQGDRRRWNWQCLA